MPANLPRRATSQVRHIFIEFAHRDGILREHAADELNRHLTVNGFIRTRESYLVMRRTGSPLHLGDRAGRARLYSTLENAINHATFED